MSNLPTPGSGRVPPEGKTLKTLAWIRAQSALHEKALQFTLIGLALSIASGAPTPGLLGNFDLIALAALPAFALLLQGVTATPLGRPAVVGCTLLQVLLFASAAHFVSVQQFWAAAICLTGFAAQAVVLDTAIAGAAGAEAPGQTERLNAWLRLLVPAGIALGTLGTGELWEAFRNQFGGWKTAGRILQVLTLASLMPVALTILLRPTPRRPANPGSTALAFRTLFGDRILRRTGLGVAYFWFAAAATSAILILAAREQAGTGALVMAARFTAAAGAGVILGNLAVALYCRKGLELDLVPAAALALAVSFLLAMFVRTGSPAFAVALACLGFSAGLFFGSLHSFLREEAGPSRIEIIFPALSWLAASAQILGLALEWGLRAAQLPARWHFAVLGLLSAGAMAYIARILPKHFLRFFFMVFVRLIYRVRRLHADRVPREGGVLMISNHVSYIDAFLLSVACPRPVRFVMIDHFLKVRAFGWFLRFFDVIPISPTRAKDAIRTTAEAIQEGALVCIFPEGQLTRTGMLNELKKGFELIVRQAQCPVLPVYMDSVWGSIFSFERFRYFSKLPRRFPYPVTVNFGHPVPPDEVSSAKARILLQDLSVEAFAERPDLRESLGAAAIRNLRRRGAAKLFVDLGQNLRRLSRREALTTSLALASQWREQLPPDVRRLGILLPQGSMPTLLHLAAVLAGRVPVHLPLSFLQDAASRDRFLKEHEIRTVVSSQALFPEQALPSGWIDLRQAISQVGMMRKLLARAGQRLLPAFLAIRRLGLGCVDRNREAVCYADETTGQLISLSHLNLLAAVHQIDSTLVLLPGDRVLVDATFTSLPALVFGLWYPCLNRNQVLFRSLLARKLDPVVILQDQKPEAVLLSPELLSQLAGSAAALPRGIRIFLDFFSASPDPARAERFGSAGAEYCIGYAPPALGAIVSMNTADPDSMIPHHVPQTGNLTGTVGRLMPGVAARLLSPDGQPLPTTEEPGYLVVCGSSLPGSADLTLDGQPYHRLPVRGQFDRQGFLTLLAGS